MSDVEFDGVTQDKRSAASAWNILLVPFATAIWIIVFDPAVVSLSPLPSLSMLLSRLLATL